MQSTYKQDTPVANNQGIVVVSNDTDIKGDITNCRQIEIHGYVEGNLSVDSIYVHNGGRFMGRVNAENAEINGTCNGEVLVKQLIKIGSSGSVTGTVRYGRLAMDEGAELSADVRNVPPEISGDLNVSVSKGGSVAITTEDLTAIDPDDTAENLTYTISNIRNGFVSNKTAPQSPITTFTQAELEQGNIAFVHDGSLAKSASFDVVVKDDDGATSGAAQTVEVDIK